MKRSLLTFFLAALVAVPGAEALHSTIVALTHGFGEPTLAAAQDIAHAMLALAIALAVLGLTGDHRGRQSSPLWLLDRRILARWRAGLDASMARSFRQT